MRELPGQSERPQCPECGQRPIRSNALCGPCYKRLIWRPANGPAVDRDREAARRWKREHLGFPGEPLEVARRRPILRDKRGRFLRVR